MQIIKGGILAIALLGAIASILLLADQGAEHSCAKVFEISAVGCILRTHKELAGGLIGAGGTIFAAWIAWVAIQRQIHAGRWYEDELLETLIEELTPFVDLLNEMSLAIEYAIEPNQQDQNSRVTAFRAALAWGHPPDEYFTKLDQLGEPLAPLSRNKFIKFMKRVRLFIERIVSFQEENLAHDLNWRVHELALAKLQLAILKIDLDAFDNKLGKRMRESTVAVNRDSWATFLKIQIESWLQEEDRRRHEGNV